MAEKPNQEPKRRRLVPAAILSGLAGTLVIAATLGASLSGLTAIITNTTNTASSASMAIQETSGAAQCNSYDATTTCSTINKYGGTATPLVPGGSQTVTVAFKNAGNVPTATNSLTPGTCVATTTGVVGATTPTTPNTTAGNLCSVINIAVYAAATATGPTIYNGAASGFTAVITLAALAVGATQSYTFVTSLPASATTAVQGQQVSQPLVWTFS